MAAEDGTFKNFLCTTELLKYCYTFQMNVNLAQALIFKHFPEITIFSIHKIGEGTGNIAYEVNTNLIFRFPKKKENQKRLGCEVIIQKILKKYSSLPFPEFIYLPPDRSFVGYRKLLGSSMLYEYSKFKNWESFSKQLGHFLTQLHSIPKRELHKIDLQTEQKSYSCWKKQASVYFEKTKHIIDKHYLSKIEFFLEAEPPKANKSLAFCHNDLGIEHFFITGNKITGIIDWGGVLTDPACDFARIYRDLGEKVLDSVLSEYVTTQFVKSELRERAIFYGKCLLFEDLFYGLRQKIYKQKAFVALKWMF